MRSTPHNLERFGAGLLDRDAGTTIVTGAVSLSREDLVSLRPAGTVSHGSAVAVCLKSNPGLVKALAAFDGFARVMLLLSPALDSDTVRSLVRDVDCGVLVSDRSDLPASVPLEDAIERTSLPIDPGSSTKTDWILTTSGTTGRPKLVRHTLPSLCRTLKPTRGDAPIAAWGLVYEPTRFAGLQVVLQACLGGGRLIATSDRFEAGRDLALLAEHGCTHLSATPSLWRRILMHPAVSFLKLRQVTLGGEIADQAILDSLRRVFPSARITHIYASTEAGVGFSVSDGIEGFPTQFLESQRGDADLKIDDGRLWLRVADHEASYLGPDTMRRDSDGYVDTLDRVELRGDRVVFLGRANGVVNVGGAKVYPERVEQVLNRMAGVALARVSSRRNPLSGSILVATVVPQLGVEDHETLRKEIVRYCRDHLPREAMPAVITIVKKLELNAAGKIFRT